MVACLFVPGDRPERFPKAASSGAGAVILDLQDAVAPPAKAAARDAVRMWLDGGGSGWFRINPVATLSSRRAGEKPWLTNCLELLLSA